MNNARARWLATGTQCKRQELLFILPGTCQVAITVLCAMSRALGSPGRQHPETNLDPVVPTARLCSFSRGSMRTRPGAAAPLFPAAVVPLQNACCCGPDSHTPASYLDHPAPFATFLHQECLRQLQHLAQPVHHHHLQLRARWAGGLSREGGEASRTGQLPPASRQLRCTDRTDGITASLLVLRLDQFHRSF